MKKQHTKQQQSKVGRVRTPSGLEYPCRAARHMPRKTTHSLYEVIAALVQLGQREQENREAYEANPHMGADEMARGELVAKRSTLVDAWGASRWTVQREVKELVKLGWLIPEKKVRGNFGHWTPRAYQVVTHFEYALRHGCPEHGVVVTAATGARSRRKAPRNIQSKTPAVVAA